MTKCEQLFSAGNYSKVVVFAAATKGSKAEAAPGVRRQLKESLKSKSIKILMGLCSYSVSPGLFIRNPRNQEPWARKDLSFGAQCEDSEQSRHPAALIALPILALENRAEKGGNTPIYSFVQLFICSQVPVLCQCTRHGGHKRTFTFPELKVAHRRPGI